MAGMVSSRVKTSVEGRATTALVRGMPFSLAVWRRKSARASMERMRVPETMLSGSSAVTAFFSSFPAKKASLTLLPPISKPTILFKSIVLTFQSSQEGCVPVDDRPAPEGGQPGAHGDTGAPGEALLAAAGADEAPDDAHKAGGQQAQ